MTRALPGPWTGLATKELAGSPAPLRWVSVGPASWGGRYYEDIRNVNEILRNIGKQLAKLRSFLEQNDMNGGRRGRESFWR